MPYITSKGKPCKFQCIQNDILNEIVEKIKISKLSFQETKSFLFHLLENYDRKRLMTISYLSIFFNDVRMANGSYTPFIFRHSKSSIRAKRILFLHYMNLLFFKGYKSRYQVRFSSKYKYYIVAISEIKRDDNIRNQYLDGISGYFSVPKRFRDERSIIEIHGKIFELHGPGLLVLVGCPNHQYCKFPKTTYLKLLIVLVTYLKTLLRKEK